MNKSESISQLAVALLAAQKEIDTARKTSKNPFFKSNYADLSEVIDTVKEPLNKNGITFLQIVDESERGAVVETTLLHESGEFISGRTPVFCGKPNDPQALGSGITYSKRYGLQAIVGLPTADDDGEAAMNRAKKPSKEVKKFATPLDELKHIIADQGKTDAQIDAMIRFAGADPVLVGLDDLESDQIDKVLKELKRRSK